MNEHTLTRRTDGPLSFVIRDSADGRPWWWYLNLNSEPLCLLGNRCGTCAAIFAYVRDTRLALAPELLSAKLNAGLAVITREVTDTVAALLPQGAYLVRIITVTPILVHAAQKAWDIGCDAPYFWIANMQRAKSYAQYELLLPLIPESILDAAQIDSYRAVFRQGQAPTVLALSLVDARAVNNEYGETALAHLILDGHHKLMAASLEGQSITLLSFLNVDASTGEISTQIRNRYQSDIPASDA